VSKKYIVQIRRNSRSFFITKTCEMTWMKDHAWAFDSKEEIKEEIKNNRKFYFAVGDWYYIVKYEDAKNH
jgi:hypothetical protein